MCNSRAYAFVFCMLFLTGCGENFTVGGVSLGGSGTGLGVPQTNTVPGGLQDGVEDSNGWEFYLDNSMIKLQQFPTDPDCSGVSRTIQFENINTGKLIPEGADVIFAATSTIKPNNAAVKIIVRNLTDKPILEHIPACTAPIKLLDQDGNAVVSQGANFNCSDSESVHLYAAGECRIFRYEFSLPQKISNWSLNYNTEYTDVDNIEINKCPSLSFDMSIEKRKSDGVMAEPPVIIFPGMSDPSPCDSISSE